jgi:MerR HTH family regulatory protein
MARKQRDVRTGRLAYFYLNGILYKTLRAEKRTNMLYALDARDHKITAFLLSDVRALGQKTYRIAQVSKMLGCANITLRRYEREGTVAAPMRWRKDLNGNGFRVYSEDNVREIREAMSEVSRGKPRADGIVVPRESLPSAEELEAMFHEEDMIYEKVDGEFVPVWKAKF